MSDLISRQAALYAIYGICNEPVAWLFRAASEIEKLPPAEPERKTARWIEDGYSHYKAVCSECGEPCATYVVNTPRDRFCKWCGARMEGVNETD